MWVDIKQQLWLHAHCLVLFYISMTYASENGISTASKVQHLPQPIKSYDFIFPNVCPLYYLADVVRVLVWTLFTTFEAKVMRHVVAYSIKLSILHGAVEVRWFPSGMTPINAVWLGRSWTMVSILDLSGCYFSWEWAKLHYNVSVLFLPAHHGILWCTCYR